MVDDVSIVSGGSSYVMTSTVELMLSVVSVQLLIAAVTRDVTS